MPRKWKRSDSLAWPLDIAKAIKAASDADKKRKWIIRSKQFKYQMQPLELDLAKQMKFCIFTSYYPNKPIALVSDKKIGQLILNFLNERALENL